MKRLEGEWPDLRLIHLPVHASWLNRIEIYFSVVRRKVPTPNDFADLEVLVERLIAFRKRYEQAAEPFAWKFTRHDLDRLSSLASPSMSRSRPHPWPPHDRAKHQIISEWDHLAECAGLLRPLIFIYGRH